MQKAKNLAQFSYHLLELRYCRRAIGVVVSIVASQAIDPGSIPGWRRRFIFAPFTVSFVVFPSDG